MTRLGAMFRGVEPGDVLIVEPTGPDDYDVVLWAHIDGREQESFSLRPDVLRALAADLAARADLIDPRSAS